MARQELNTSIDTTFDDTRPDYYLTPSMEGTELKKVADYAEELSPIKTSGTVTLSATTSVLPHDVNSCSFTGGKAYLPPTTRIGKEIYVIANSNNIEISANLAGASKMFTTPETYVANVILSQYQMYRFVYIGFGLGVGGVTDGYWKAEKLQLSTDIDTAFVAKTYAPTMSVAYNPEQPNFDINLTGNLDLTITGTTNGEGGLINLYFTGTEVATLNGLTDLVITGAGGMIPVQYIHGSDGLRWFRDEVGGASVDTSLFAVQHGTILYHTAIATNVGTFSNIGTACTGTGTAITDEMVGAKIVKANGEIGIITARASDTSFTVSGFLTNSVGTAFEVRSIAYIVNSNGSIEVRDQTGKRLDYYYSDGNGRELGTNITCYRRITASNCFMDGDNIQSPKLTVTTATTYANDAAADADTNLQSKELYWITGDRVPRRKP